MRMPSASVLANAVINITANTRGLDHAMAETRRQMHGFMTMANSFGGRFGGLLSNIYGVTMYRGGGGMGAIANAMANAQNLHAQQMANWRGQRPQRANFWQMVGGLPGGFNQQGYNSAVAAWQSAKPSAAAAQAQALQGVALAAGEMTLAIGVTVGALGLLAAGATALAKVTSNAKEARDRTHQTFGSYSGVIFDQAERNAAQYGTAKRETMHLASASGMLLQSAGIGAKQSATMGASLAQAAVEASSLHEVPVEESMLRIQSALSGTSRAIREFGVMITEERVDARALQLGLVGLNGHVSDSAKTVARYSLIMEGLSRASGDIERSQGRYATQMRMLQGNLENLGAALGELFLPTVIDVVSSLNWLAQAMTPSASVLGDAMKILNGATLQDLAQEHADELNKQMEIDKRNEDLILAANETSAAAMMAKGSGRGSRHTDLAGLHKSIQDAVTGDKNAILRDQVELQKRAIDVQMRLNDSVDKMLAIQKAKQGGRRF